MTEINEKMKAENNLPPLNPKNYEKTIFNPRWFMENMLWIVDKKNNLVRFKLNYEQSVLMNHVEFCLANDMPVRIIILKARQIGSTTFWVGLGYWMASMHKNSRFGIIAHKQDSAQDIFKKCQVFYYNLPEKMRLETTQMSQDGITFNKKDGTGINSDISFAVASENVFRSKTMTVILESEIAFWTCDINTAENSLNSVVPYEPNTIVIKESTAQGYNEFKDEWDLAEKHQSIYHPFFFGWQDHKEYVRNAPRDMVYNEKELELIKKFNLTPEQIEWRREMIMEFKGDIERFNQEFPMTPEEAFIVSGGTVFSHDCIKRGYESVKEPILILPIKSLEYSYEKLEVWEEPGVKEVKVRQQEPKWNVEKQEWEYVDTDMVLSEDKYLRQYTLGIDTSGLGQDMNQFVVVDNETKRVVARFGKERIPEEKLAEIGVEIARYYNDAMIIPEVNFSHEICNHIRRLGYNNIYVTENVNNIDRASAVSGVTMQYGFMTTGKTKSSLISNLRMYIDDETSSGLIPDKAFWKEAEYYIMEDSTKNIMNASSGHHDDIVMATALAFFGSCSIQSMQKPRKTSREVENKSIEQNDFFKRFLDKDKNKKTKVPMKGGIFNNHA